MFCQGEDGYSIDIPEKSPSKKTVSACAFYAYRAMKRSNELNHLLLYQDLWSRFLVDMYAKVETEKLNYLRFNQPKLRVENYDQLRDAINNRDVQQSSSVNNQIGRPVILPATYVGGPRYMAEKAQEAMTYVRKYSKPDIFLTFTCNPNWVEIKESLENDQNVSHRHDIIARVFWLKVKKLKSIIVDKKIFGEVIAFVYSVEWQKRGLPHIHMLIWLRNKLQPNQIDQLVSAELPDPEKDPELHNLVKTHMVHGPCGAFNQKCQCMKNNCCSKGFPKQFLKDTQLGNDGYPKYRRRSPSDGGFTCVLKNTVVDNRWVVPYNPVLLRFFGAHINIEACYSVKSIKYVLKYVLKGDDQAAFAMQDKSKDEIQLYQNGKYLILIFFWE